jgi:retron-type reverse transcriptase
MTATARPLQLLLGPPVSSGRDQDFDVRFELTAVKAAYRTKVESRGGRGIDRIGVDSFNLQADAQLSVASRKALSGEYRFAPYLEQLLPRGPQRFPRRISVPTLRDRVVLQQLKSFLEGPFSSSLERRLPNEFIRRIRQFAVGANLGMLSVLRTDISSFYDCVEHDVLFDKIRHRVSSERARALLRRAVRNPTLGPFAPRSDRTAARNRRGVPQGLAISNLLASIYLEDVDARMVGASLLYLRYVDDILVVAASDRIDGVETILRQELQALGLELNQAKTTKTHASEPFEYLGYRFELPQASVRQGAVERFLRTIAARFSAYQHRSNQGNHQTWLSVDQRRRAFIDDLNERITGAISGASRYGWLFYYSEVDDLALLHKLDAVIRGMFSRLADFRGQSLGGLKRLSRAYFEIRYSPTGGYVHDYNAIATPTQKLSYLVRRGLIDPASASSLSVDQVEARFSHERERRLNDLDRDVGRLY